MILKEKRKHVKNAAGTDRKEDLLTRGFSARQRLADVSGTKSTETERRQQKKKEEAWSSETARDGNKIDDAECGTGGCD